MLITIEGNLFVCISGKFYDPDGTALTFVWHYMLRGAMGGIGSGQASGITATLQNLLPGFYDIYINVTDEDDESQTTMSLLHAVILSKGNIPIELVRCIVETGGSELASVEDDDGMTPLHLVVTEKPRRTDIARYLVDQAPDTVGRECHTRFR